MTPILVTRRENSMSFGTGALASAVGGIVLGGIVAFGANSAMAENSIPEVAQPPADQALLGQVEYGAR
ncbi:DUF2613 domain-containing protein [Dietzia sp. SLG310A2-38A2]|nr:DUF2613 domain-containing protein [Dietzia sp. SLG310A2-38A2]